MWLLRAILLALLPCVTVAQLLPVSNVVLRGGIAPGYTELQTNGMIRWNQTLLRHEGWNGNSWNPIAGSGSGFPLTNSAFANTPGSNTSFGVYDMGFLDFLGSTNLLYFNTSSNKLFFGGEPVGAGEGSLREISADGVTNKEVEFLNFVAGSAIAIDHTTNSTLSTVTVSFDGQILELIYRGEYNPSSYYSTNQFVTVSTFFGNTNDTPILGQNLFRNAYVVRQGITNVPFINKNPSDTNYWVGFVSQGFPGADGAGNLYFDPIPWQVSLSYSNNTLVSYDDELYVSLTNINPAVLTNAFINNTSFWRRVVRRGVDGEDGVSIIETISYVFTNQVVQGLTFRGPFDVSPPHTSFSSNDLVTHEGSAYFTPSNIIANPPTPPASPWILFSAKGLDGTQAGNIASNLFFTKPIDFNGTVYYPSNSVVRFDGSLWYSVTNVDQSALSGGTKLPPLNLNDSVTVTSNQYWNLLVPRGDKGADGGIGLDGVFKNDFNLFNPGGYNVNDLVYFDGGLWRCIQAQLSGSIQLPGVPSSYWELLIRSGRDGNTGTALAYYGPWQQSQPGVPLTWTTNNVVSYTPPNERGGLWVCIQNHTSDQQPTTGSAYWRLIVADGLDGYSFDLSYRGDFVSGQAYTTNELVKYPTDQSYSYLWRPLVNIPSGTPGVPSTPNWEIVVSGVTGPAGADGATGNTGPAGPKGDDGADLVFKGDYVSSVVYPTNTLVSYSNQVWFTKVNVSTNNFPGVNTNLWGIFLRSGEDGQDGIGNMFFQGAWATNRTYATNDLVQYSNAVYVAITNIALTTPPNNTNYWLKLFEGVAGPTGASVTNAQISGTNLILYLSNGTSINAGNAKGPTGSQGIPGVGLNYVGAWNSASNYSTNILVTYTGSTFYSVAASSNQAPPNAAFWELFVSKGAQGVQGVQGSQGIQGIPGAGLTFLGPWSSSSNYVPSNLVYYAGANWYALLSSTNKVPGALNEGYWAQFVSPGAALIPRGTWTNIAYATNELVFYSGSSYYSISNNNTTVPTNTLYWRLFAQRGDDGLIQGATWTGPSNSWVTVSTNAAVLDFQFSSGFINYLTTGVGGATNIQAGSSDSYNSVTRILTWNTNAVKGFVWEPIPISANYTSVAYNFVLADTTASDILITLPSASVNSGKVVAARKMSSSNTLYVRAPSGNLVQGVGTVGVIRAGSVIEVISNGGTNWWLK